MVLIFLHTDSYPREKHTETLVMVEYGQACIDISKFV